MQRRSESGQPGQSANRPKAHNAPTGQESTDRSTEQFDRLERERDEAREQRAATAEILRVIRASPNDVQPVFETIVRNAVSLSVEAYLRTCFVSMASYCIMSHPTTLTQVMRT